MGLEIKVGWIHMPSAWGTFQQCGMFQQWCLPIRRRVTDGGIINLKIALAHHQSRCVAAAAPAYRRNTVGEELGF